MFRNCWTHPWKIIKPTIGRPVLNISELEAMQLYATGNDLPVLEALMPRYDRTW